MNRDTDAQQPRTAPATCAASAFLLLALLCASTAQAAPPVTIAEFGSGAGKVNGPVGVAVDQSTGSLYVADRNNFRIDKFDSEGNVLLAWGWGVADGKSQVLQVCGPAAEPPTKRCFSSSAVASGPGAVAPEAVAVEPSSGDVYVADPIHRRVSKFTPSGELLLLFGPDVAFSGPGNTGADETQQVTVKATAGSFALALAAPAPLGAGAVKETTAPIAHDASAAAVQAALEALPGVEAGDLSVTGGPGDASGSSPYAVEFTGGPFAGNDVAQMGADSSALVGSQTVTVQGASGGTFTLIFKGVPTTAIPHDASAATVQGALEALTPIGAGNVSVSGPAGGPWTASFAGSLAGSPQPAIGASGADLLPSGASVSVAPPAAVATAAPGGGPEVCEPGRGDLCKAAGPGGGPGEFTNPRALAFGSEGKLWVASSGRLQRFDPDGAFLSEVPLPPGAQSAALAIDPGTGDFYVLGPAGRNEGQVISLATASEYTLSFEGQSTAPIASSNSGATTDTEAEAIQLALEALPAIGPGNVSVAAFFNDRYSVTFIHDLGGRDVPPMSASGGSPPVTIKQGGQGAPGSVLRLDSTGALVETLHDAPGDIPLALGVDTTGDLYVGDAGFPYRFLRFDSAGGLGSVFGAGQVAGNIFGNGGPAGNALAFDEAAGALYAANPLENTIKRYSLPEPGPLPDDQRAEEIEPTSATLAATLNPEGRETTYHFEYDTVPYEGDAEHGTKVPVPDATLPASFEDVPVEAALEGLIPDTAYHFRLVASNECEPAEECTVYGPDTAFRTRTAVGIEAQWATDVAARGATVRAELEPLGVAGQWWVEYGTSTAYGFQSARFALPAAFGAIPVSVALTGLQPATTYHYRFVAEDKREGATYLVQGEDRAFTTQLAGLGFELPDGRAWEMVSPPDKHGGRVAGADGADGGQVQAAANGEALAYLSYGSLEESPQGSRLIEQSSQLARRGAGGAWSTQDITPPHGTVTPFGNGVGLEYKLFSPGLGRALMEPRECTPLSPAASERTPYVRENGEPPTYTPLVTSKEGFANVPAGTAAFGGDCANISLGLVEVRGASADLGHVVLGSPVPLASGAASGSLYVWAGGTLQALSVPPGGEGSVRAELGAGSASLRGAVSLDGSRVFWTASGSLSLYVRDSVRGETARLDEVQPGGFGTGAVAPLFQAASADGSVAFFTDTQNLTADANEAGADLYRCELVVEGGALKCDLADLTAQTASFGESADVQGVLPGVGENGNSAYFVARGVLDSEPSGTGETAVSGQPNLYAWQEGEGVRFVARLAEDDERDWGWPTKNTSGALAIYLTAAASPSGRYLAFMSERALTGYDNRAVGSGERAQEVFRYDAHADELLCVSCNPSGARPRALVPGPGAGQLAEEFDPQKLWSGKEVAAVVPEPTKINNNGDSLYRSRYVHDDGRVFFNAADSLVAADSNGDGDVYQYEPTGTGGCTPSSGTAGTAVVPGGCVSLLSSGTAAGTAAFLDASEGGDDVFFYTPARLAVSDVDNELDVYDARVGGEPARLSPSAECQGEACQPPATPPQLQTPASAAFRGPGNLPARSRCAGPARRAQKLSRRAGRSRRNARRMARDPAKRKPARRLGRKARRLSRRATAMSKRAKRCRRAEQRRSR